MASDPAQSYANAVHALARIVGVQTSYRDNDGRRRTASLDVILAALNACGLPVTTTDNAAALLRDHSLLDELTQPNAVAWNGQLREVTLTGRCCEVGDRLDIAITDNCASGRPAVIATTAEVRSARRPTHAHDPRTVHRLHFASPLQLPLGYYTIHITLPDGAQREAQLFSAPRRCYGADEPIHHLGVFLPLYSLHNEDDFGIGDLGHFQALSRWAAECGCHYAGTLPLLACFLDKPYEPSPYSPITRLFWNELYIDPHSVPEFHSSTTVQRLVNASATQSEMAELRSGSLVQYDRAMRLKRQLLEALAQAAFHNDQRRAEIDAFAEREPYLADYARFRAAVERTGHTWQDWPHHTLPDNNDEQLSSEVWYHRYVQFLLHEQLRQVRTELPEDGGLYLDLPVGVHGAGFDVWQFREQFVESVSVGAPPDAFFSGGQNWGFPPLNPLRSRRCGHSYFTASLRNHMRFASLLRIDHVMGLHRLYWIPPGCSATEGVYVHYPIEELYATLSIESHRHSCRVVGENLGTVPAEVDQSLAPHGIYGMHISQFCFRNNKAAPLELPVADQLAAMNTHDMPPFASFWTGDDIRQREELGLLDQSDAADDLTDRHSLRKRVGAWLTQKGLLPEAQSESSVDVIHALHQVLAESDAAMLILNLEDLWAERLPQNMPGVGLQYPSWRRKAAHSLDTIVSSPQFAAAVKALASRRRHKQTYIKASTPRHRSTCRTTLQ